MRRKADAAFLHPYIYAHTRHYYRGWLVCVGEYKAWHVRPFLRLGMYTWLYIRSGKFIARFDFESLSDFQKYFTSRKLEIQFYCINQ